MSEDIDLSQRVQRVELINEQIDKRLHQGSETFADIRRSLEDLREEVRPRPQTVKIVGVVTGIVALVGGAIWALSRYPDRAEFQALKESTDARVTSVQKELAETSRRQYEAVSDQRVIKVSVENQGKTIDAINGKLDKLLEKGRR